MSVQRDKELRRIRRRTAVWRFRTLPYLRSRMTPFLRASLARRRFAGAELILDLSRTDTHLLLWSEGERFVLERHELLRRVGRGDTVVDVGANIGYIALLLAAAVGPAGHVHCLEPVPENLDELRRNVAENGLSQVRVWPMAAGSSDGRVRIAGGFNGSIRPDDGDLDVELRRLDSLPIASPALVKIDVEGHELAVLRGAEAWLRESAPRLWIEVHPELVPEANDASRILELLVACGYRTFRGFRPARPRVPVRVALARYLGIATLESTDHPSAWFDSASSGGRSDPIWLAAEREP